MMRAPLTLLVSLFVLFWTPFAFAAPLLNEHGDVPIQVFANHKDRARTEIYGMTQGANGLMYFAGGDGLVEFDGEHWNAYPMSSSNHLTETVGVSAIALGPKGGFVVGGSNQLGFFLPRQNGWHFASLFSMLPELEAPLGVVRQVHLRGDEIYFLSQAYLLRWDFDPSAPLRGEMKVVRDFHNLSRGVTLSIQLIDDGETLLLLDPDLGLTELRQGDFRSVPRGDFFLGQHVVGAYRNPAGERIVLTSRAGLYKETSSGFVPWDVPVASMLVQQRAMGLLATHTGERVIVISPDQVVLMDEMGQNPRLFRDVPSIAMAGQAGFVDAKGSLWLASAEGALRMHLNAPAELFDASNGLFGQVLALESHQGRLYAGTVEGLFRLEAGATSLEPARFVPLSKDMLGCSSILSMGQELLFANHRGVFSRDDHGNVTQVHAGIVQRLVRSRDPNAFYLCNSSNGVMRLARLQGKWVVTDEVRVERRVFDVVEGVDREVWCVVELENGGTGLTRTELGATGEIQRFGAQHGLPAEGRLQPVWYQGEFLVGSKYGALRWNRESEHFDALTSALGPLQNTPFGVPLLLSPRVDPEGHLWFLQDETQTVRITGLGVGDSIALPFEWGDGHQYRNYVFDGNLVWATANDGRLLRYERTPLTQASSAAPYLQAHAPEPTGMDAHGDEFAYHPNEIYRFEYSIKRFNQGGDHFYQSRLVGQDKDWQPWTQTAARTFIGLAEGVYTFEVRSWQPGVGASDVAAYRFAVMPPWYRTQAGYLITGGVLIGAVGLFVLWRMQITRRRVRELEAEVRQRIRAEEERDALEAELRQAQKMEAVGTLAAGVAHDFNNSLTAILGFTDLVRRQQATGLEIGDSLDSIQHAAEQAAGITRGLLMFSHKAKVERYVADLSSLVAQAVDLVRVTLPAMIDFQVDLEPGVLVEADSVQIEQVLINLVSNARDAMPLGGVLTVQVRHSTPEEDRTDGAAAKRALLIVQDAGKGIPDSIRERIFDPFFTTKGRGQGTGLGMSIVLGIVQAHQGEIRLNPAGDKGTRVTISLPVAHGSIAAPLPKSRPYKLTVQGSLVLIVEDNAGVRQLMVNTLRQVGFNVITASDGQAAMEQFEKHCDELAMVFLDLDLPKKSGVECLRLMRESHPDLPVLIVTGKAGSFEDGLEPPLPRVLNKPFLPMDLHGIVDEILSPPRDN